MSESLATSHLKPLYLFSDSRLPPLELALLKADLARRVSVPRGNLQLIGDGSHWINTPVCLSFGGKILKFALCDVPKGPRWVKVQPLIAMDMNLGKLQKILRDREVGMLQSMGSQETDTT